MSLHKGYVTHCFSGNSENVNLWNGKNLVVGNITPQPYENATIQFSDDEPKVTYHPWSCSYCRILNPKEQISYCLACGAPNLANNEIPFKSDLDRAWYAHKIAESAWNGIVRIKK